MPCNLVRTSDNVRETTPNFIRDTVDGWHAAPPELFKKHVNPYVSSIGPPKPTFLEGFYGK